MWSSDRKDEFGPRESQLLFSAARAPELQRFAARVDLARFYLAWERFAEAKGVLDVALKDNPPSAGDPVPLVMRAVANIMLERPQEALKDLANPIVGNQFDAPLWRAWADARLGRWADANEGFRDVDSRIARLPVELQRKLLREIIRVAIEIGDVAGAVNAMHEFEILGVPHELEPGAQILDRASQCILADDVQVDTWHSVHDQCQRAQQGRLVFDPVQGGDVQEAPGRTVERLGRLGQRTERAGVNAQRSELDVQTGRLREPLHVPARHVQAGLFHWRISRHLMPLDPA